jgi:hypothetical protein
VPEEALGTKRPLLKHLQVTLLSWKGTDSFLTPTTEVSGVTADLGVLQAALLKDESGKAPGGPALRPRAPGEPSQSGSAAQGWSCLHMSIGNVLEGAQGARRLCRPAMLCAYDLVSVSSRHTDEIGQFEAVPKRWHAG